MDGYLRLREVCDKLSVSRNTAIKLINDCGLPAIKVGGHWRISKAELDAWLEKAKSEATTAASPS